MYVPDYFADMVNNDDGGTNIAGGVKQNNASSLTSTIACQVERQSLSEQGDIDSGGCS